MKYLKLFEEVTLTLSELEKSRNGQKRGNKLITKLKENPTKLTINGGEKVITAVKVEDETGKKVSVTPAEAADKISDNGEYNSDEAKKVFKKAPGYRNYDNVLVTKDGEYPLTKVTKTKDFGSSGPGVFIREYEAIQCLFIAYKLKFPRQMVISGKEKDYMDSVLNFWQRYQNGNPAALKKINIYLDEKVKITSKLLEDLGSNKDWISTFTKVPKELFRYKGMFDIEKSYSVFHESNSDPSSPVKKLIDKFNHLKLNKCKICKGTGKVDNESCKKCTNGRVKLDRKLDRNISFSKFCPADVYIVQTDIINSDFVLDKIVYNGLNKSISKCEEMEDLIKLMDLCFDNNLLIPISLKKIKSGNETFQIIINKEKNKKLPEFDIKHFRVTQDVGKGIGSRISTLSKWADINIDPTNINKEDEPIKVNRDITFDSSNTGNSVNVDGEVSGSSSRHGKISFSAIKSILDNYNKNNKINNFTELEKHSELKAKNNDLRRQNLEILREKISILQQQLLELREFDNGVDVIEMPSTEVVPKKKKGDPTGETWTRLIRYTDLTNDDSDNIENKLISKLQSLQILVSIANIYKQNSKIGNEVITDIMSYALSIKTDFETPRYLRII